MCDEPREESCRMLFWNSESPFFGWLVCGFWSGCSWLHFFGWCALPPSYMSQRPADLQERGVIVVSSAQ